MATPRYIPCANWTVGGTACKKTGTFSCKSCKLVSYCGPVCQKSHWSVHKTDCKSPLSSTSWKPGWEAENRTPSFVGDNDGPSNFGGMKYYWGNVPALDVLKLRENEGAGHEKHLRILCAASGDFRNVVKTIAQLPSSYSGTVEVTLNDKELDIVARNAIMLLIGLVVDNDDNSNAPNMDTAIDCIIHIWYSALIRPSDLSILQTHIRPLIADICTKTANKPPHTLLAKTWTFPPVSSSNPTNGGPPRTLRLILQKQAWDRILSFLDVPQGLTAEKAHKIRTGVTLARERRDHRDRYYTLQVPAQRVAKERFREDGVMLPFGMARQGFLVPNPTFFQDGTWHMPDNANPLDGWSEEELAEYPHPPASADMYGKMYYYLRAMLRDFLIRVAEGKVTFRLFHMDAAQLPKHVEASSFDRIDVSNISDAGYLGLYRTLNTMIPLLTTPSTNRHATLITFFMNAIPEMSNPQDTLVSMGQSKTKLMQYMPNLLANARVIHAVSGGYQYSLEAVKFVCALELMGDHDAIWDRYTSLHNFSHTASLCNASMKPQQKHTIIEAWPYRLKLQPGQPGAQAEFDRRLAGGMSGKERYVEWSRKV
ncbi:hypothetical protein B0J18DRAFT_417793 [Chaetomium sp. MPI-SDFR-AT-0129]|nr:hypothetical protein B0J18DRAFT_417793 [Chaetomium sp. MPI-SDFR-AT-0129]